MAYTLEIRIDRKSDPGAWVVTERELFALDGVVQRQEWLENVRLGLEGCRF